MIESGEGDFAVAPQNINIVANQYIYNLASLLNYNPVKVRLVERSYSNEWVTLPKWEKTTGSFYNNGVGSGEFFPSYRFTGTNLVFNQMPNFAQTAGFRVEGYKQPADLSADGDSPDANFHPIYHDILVLHATVSCIEAKEATGMTGDPAMFRTRLEKREFQFIDTINNRSFSRESVDPFVVDGESSWG